MSRASVQTTFKYPQAVYKKSIHNMQTLKLEAISPAGTAQLGLQKCSSLVQLGDCAGSGGELAELRQDAEQGASADLLWRQFKLPAPGDSPVPMVQLQAISVSMLIGLDQLGSLWSWDRNR